MISNFRKFVSSETSGFRTLDVPLFFNRNKLLKCLAAPWYRIPVQIFQIKDAENKTFHWNYTMVIHSKEEINHLYINPEQLLVTCLQQKIHWNFSRNLIPPGSIQSVWYRHSGLNMPDVPPTTCTEIKIFPEPWNIRHFEFSKACRQIVPHRMGLFCTLRASHVPYK
jgi:hypothetical protein